MEKYKVKVKDCNHENAYHFHNNAPKYCPDCGAFVDGGVVVASDDLAISNCNNKNK